MEGFGLIAGLLALAWLMGKIRVNRDEDLSENQEAERNKAAMKHQGWQTLDWTEPWNKR